MHPRNVRILYLASACAAALTWSPALAQSSAGAGVTQLDDVIVTAQRREESLQDVPVSVTALSAEALEQKQVGDIMALGKVAPGMQAKPTFNPMEMTIAIRGVTQLIPSINSDPAIGIYIDGVYNVLNAGSNTAMIDMERAEVLRGPQGTLFGRNTIGGSLNITTAKPTDQLEGYLQADVGTYGAWTVTGVVNLPLAPGKVDTRLVYQHNDRDGFGTNFVTGRKTSALNTDYVRGSVRINFSDDWDLQASASYLDGEGTAAPTKLAYFDPTSALTLSIAPLFSLPPNNVFFPAAAGNPGDLMTNYLFKGDSQDGYSNTDNTFKIEQTTFRATLTGRLTENLTLKSISGYAKTDFDTSQDIDGTPYGFLDLIAFPVHLKQWSEEIQILGEAFDARLTWITGLYYFHNEGSQVSNALALPAVNALFGAPAFYNPAGGATIDNSSYSAFAQFTYALTPQLNLTAGARYVKDKRSAVYHDHKQLPVTGTFLGCSLASTPAATSVETCVYSGSADFHYTPWTVGLDYALSDDVLLYGKVSRGYRSGAFALTGPAATDPNPGLLITPAVAAAANAAALAAFAPVAPEKLTSFELGVKGEYLDRRLRINAAVFHSKYANVQVEEDLPGACATCTPISKIQNTGAVEINGAELEVTAILGKLTVDAGLGYSNPKYEKGPFVGKPVINTSDFNGTINASYPIEFNSGTLTLAGGYSYRSKSVLFTLASGLNGADLDAMTQKGYGLLDARASFEFANAPVIMSLYAQNLTDKKYKNSGDTFNPPLSFSGIQYGSPRTVGASIKYSF